MKPKPEHLTEEWASQWEDACMAEAYPARPPYPDGVYDVLARLAGDGRILDVGCGTGDVGRALALRGLAVDGVDRSAAMIAKGRTLPGGNRVNWIVGLAEEAPLRPPYSLVTAGECIHWLDWERAFPRLRAVAPTIALIFRFAEPAPWEDELRAIIPHYSTNHRYYAYDLMAELAERDLFHAAGEEHVEPVDFVQSIDDYVTSIHSRNGFSHARMDPQAAAEFDAQVRTLLEPHAVNGKITLRIHGCTRYATEIR